MCPMIRIKSERVLHMCNEIQQVLVLSGYTACLYSQDVSVANASRVWGLLHVHGDTASLTSLHCPCFQLVMSSYSLCSVEWVAM